MNNSVNISSEDFQLLDLLASVVREAKNAILILDPLGNVIWANQAFTNFYGFSKEEYNQRQHSDNSEYIQVLHNTDRNFFKKGKPLSFSRVLFNHDGERKWVLSTITPMFNVAGEVKQFIVIETDITQQKEVEEELIQRQENTQTLSEHLESVKDYVEEQITILNEQKDALEKAKEKSEEVLHKVLPYEVAIQLKKKGYATPRHYKKVTVMHLNLRNFFTLSDDIPLEVLVTDLHESMVQFDGILEQHYVEKIKSTGGIYIGAGGVPLRNRSNPIDVVLAALKIRNILGQINELRKEKGDDLFHAGFGIHTGKVIAGVVGKNKLSYDIWGDTVNIAATIENIVPEGEIVISSVTHEEIADYFDCVEFQSIVLSSAEKIDLFTVQRIKALYSEDNAGLIPNNEFLQILSKL